MTKTVTAAMQRLMDVLERENAALTALDYAGSAALMSEKRAALDAFERLRPNQGTPAWPPALLAAAEDLRQLTAANQRLLERALIVQGRIVQLIAHAASDAEPAPRYGATGKPAPARRTMPIALSAYA